MVLVATPILTTDEGEDLRWAGYRVEGLVSRHSDSWAGGICEKARAVRTAGISTELGVCVLMCPWWPSASNQFRMWTTRD